MQRGQEASANLGHKLAIDDLRVELLGAEHVPAALLQRYQRDVEMSAVEHVGDEHVEAVSRVWLVLLDDLLLLFAAFNVLRDSVNSGLVRLRHLHVSLSQVLQHCVRGVDGRLLLSHKQDEEAVLVVIHEASSFDSVALGEFDWQLVAEGLDEVGELLDGLLAVLAQPLTIPRELLKVPLQLVKVLHGHVLCEDAQLALEHIIVVLQVTVDDVDEVLDGLLALMQLVEPLHERLRHLHLFNGALRVVGVSLEGLNGVRHLIDVLLDVVHRRFLGLDRIILSAQSGREACQIFRSKALGADSLKHSFHRGRHVTIFVVSFKLLPYMRNNE